MRAPLTILTVVAALVVAGCSPSDEGSNYTHVADDDAEMNAAISKAKSTADDFVRAFHAQKPGAKDYFVKKPFRTPNNGMEHMWIEVVSEEKGVLKGRVANDAEETREVKMGQSISLKLSEISDWKYQDGRKLMGGYTIRYFIDKMSAEERAAFQKEAGFEL